MPKKLKPFESIGLCFSGGGYRATFYSLGIISYLNHVQFKGKPLLEAVTAISSVSGGTLLAVAYAKAAQEPKHDFKKFYSDFYQAFNPKNDKLLETAIKKLEDDKIWKTHPYKSRSLINAFALTYSEMDVFKGDFAIFKQPNSKHLSNLCFNATDFSFGLPYRFQNTGHFGNAPLSNDLVDKLRFKIQLSDVIASSSCFPLGFAPMHFPDDYFKDHQAKDYMALKKLDQFTEGVGIMDGAITDNQGIESMLLFNESIKEPFNLIIVNDVSSYKMLPYKQDRHHKKPSMSLKQFLYKYISYLSIKPLYLILLFAGVFMVLLNTIRFFESSKILTEIEIYILGSILIGIGLVLTLLGGLATLVKLFLRRKIRAIFHKNVPESLVHDILSLKKIDIGLVHQMLINRLTSSSKLIADVFLNQMSRLNYDLFYAKASLKNKRITTTVYKLNGEETSYLKGKPIYDSAITPKPSKDLMGVALIASETPTTLWWDKKDIANHRMDSLIACGQFTLCYELMEYILELKKQEKELNIDFKEIDVLFKSLEKDWKAFNKDPMFMVEA